MAQQHDFLSNEKVPQPFYQSKEDLWKFCRDTFEDSANYAGIKKRWAENMKLADRLLVATRGEYKFEALTNLLNMNLKESIRNPCGEAARQVFLLMESWVAAIVSLAEPPPFTCSLKSNLYEHLIRLDLLKRSEAELDIKKKCTITDSVRQAVFSAKEVRNRFAHEAPELNSRDFANCLVVMLAALDRWRDEIKVALFGIITRSPTKTCAEKGRQLDAERGRHLSSFVGRKKELRVLSEVVEDIIESGTGGYLAIVGVEGQGKSAFLSQWTFIRESMVTSRGRDASIVKKRMPWLPGTLFYTGKQGTSPSGMVRHLVEQANCMLMELVDMPSEPNPLAAPNKHEQRSLFMPLNRALARLAEQRGEVVLVLAALDEVWGGEMLSFLPPPYILPRQCTIIISLRPEQPLIGRVRNILQPVHEYTLAGLAFEDVKDILSINDEQWLRKAYNKSQGNALHVTELAKTVQKATGDLKSVDPLLALEERLKSRVERWRTKNVDWSKDELRQLLLLLAVFEPVAPMSVGLAQSWLRCKGIDLAADQLQERIETVRGHLIGSDGTTLKLADRPLAEYVREKRLSKTDLRSFLSDCAGWLATTLGDDSYWNVDMVSSFLSYWSMYNENEFLSEVRNFTVKAKSLAPKKKDQPLFLWRERLYELFTTMLELEHSKNLDIEILRVSANLGFPDAQAMLGSVLIDGIACPREEKEGLGLLKQAVRSGSTEGMLNLGVRYYWNMGLPWNKKEGLDYLQRAKELGSENAMLVCSTINKKWEEEKLPSNDPTKYQLELLKKIGAMDVDLDLPDLADYITEADEVDWPLCDSLLAHLFYSPALVEEKIGISKATVEVLCRKLMSQFRNNPVNEISIGQVLYKNIMELGHGDSEERGLAIDWLRRRLEYDENWRWLSWMSASGLLAHGEFIPNEIKRDAVETRIRLLDEGYPPELTDAFELRVSNILILWSMGDVGEACKQARLIVTSWPPEIQPALVVPIAYLLILDGQAETAAPLLDEMLSRDATGLEQKDENQIVIGLLLRYNSAIADLAMGKIKKALTTLKCISQGSKEESVAGLLFPCRLDDGSFEIIERRNVEFHQFVAEVYRYVSSTIRNPGVFPEKEAGSTTKQYERENN